MRLVIDMQGAQSDGSRGRGIGRYTLDLIDAMIEQPDGHDIHLCLNGMFGDTIVPLRDRYESKIGLDNIHVWTAPGPTLDLNIVNTQRRVFAELTREIFIATLAPDAVLVTSLFEGLGDNAVTSIDRAALGIPYATILYDLIPLMHRERYLTHAPVADWYERKLQHIRRADLLLSISADAKENAEQYLSWPDANVVNISAAANETFRPAKMSSAQAKVLKKQFGIRDKFIMYTGGMDVRKNVPTLIAAYAKLPDSIRTSHQLAIVCSMQPDQVEDLHALARYSDLPADALVITGFVSDADLVGLYSICDLFVFPPWFEGFGLPALEAMQCGAAAIGSNCSSIPEVIGRSDALFDPYSANDMAKKMGDVLTDAAFQADLRAHGLRQSGHFTWAKSAKTALDALALMVTNYKNTRAPQMRSGRQKLAFLSPLPPQKSGIANYAAELLPALSRHYDITLITDETFFSVPALLATFDVKPIQWFKENGANFDRIVYQFGNSAFHTHMFDLLAQFPGVVVLHDFYLSGASHYREAMGEVSDGFWRDLYADHGYHALQKRLPPHVTQDAIDSFPTNLRVLNDANGVLVHSQHAINLGQQFYEKFSRDRCMIIPSLRQLPDLAPRSIAREKLGIDPSVFLVCSFGYMADTKLNIETIKAFKLALEQSDGRNGKLVFVGVLDGNYKDKVEALVKKFRLEDSVEITGWADGALYNNYLGAADLAIQLRANSRGETSAAIIEAMGAGLPAIVNASGAMAELPETCVVLLQETFEIKALAAAISALWESPTKRTQLGQDARSHVATHHNPSYVAEKYHQAIEAFHDAPFPPIKALIENSIEQGIIRSPEAAHACAEAAVKVFAEPIGRHQLLIDVSDIISNDDGAEQARLRAVLCADDLPFRPEPVFRDAKDRLRYARRFCKRLLPDIKLPLDDDLIDFSKGDVLLSNAAPETAAGTSFETMSMFGVQFYDALDGLTAFGGKKEAETGTPKDTKK